MSGDALEVPEEPRSSPLQDRQIAEPIFLRTALANALARRGFERVSAPAATVSAPKLVHGPTELLLIGWWLISYAAVSLFDAPLVLAIFVPPVVFILGGALVEKRIGGIILGTCLAVPFVILLYSTFWNHDLFLLGFLAPAIVVLAFALLARVLVSAVRDFSGFVAGVTRGTPLIAPLVLVFLLFPLMTKDMWEVAASMSTQNLVSIFFLTLVATYAIVYFKLRSEIERVSDARISGLCDNDSRGILTRRFLSDALGSKNELKLKVDRMTDETIDLWWPSSADEYSRYLVTIERRTLSAPLKFRLALTAFAFSAVLFGYVYAIAKFGIPEATVETWIGDPRSEGTILGVTITTDAYFKTSVLAAVIGTAGFLAFTMIEERFSTELTTALIRRPLDQFLALAIPFVHLEDLFGGVNLDDFYSEGSSAEDVSDFKFGSEPD